MALRESYEDIEEIPEAYRPLYKEVKEGESTKHIFDTSQFEGGTVIGTKGRLKLQEEAGGYRTKLKEAKTTLDKYTSLGTLEELTERMGKFPELEAAAAANGSKSKEAVDAQVNTRLAGEKTKWEREIAPKLAEGERNGKLVAHYEQAQITQAVRDAALKAVNEFKKGKLDPGAIEDALMYAERHLSAEVERDEETGLLKIVSIRTKDGVGVTPDVDADVWLLEMLGRKQHWLQGSEGSGSNGSNRNGRVDLTGNPWTYEGWDTAKQGQILKSDRKKAEDMAKWAGTTIGGLRPKPKTPQRAANR